MAKKILITGRTGSGKTTLARELAPLIGAVVFDGDEVRALDPNPIGFTHNERVLHAKRMSGLCDVVTASGNNAIASFVCPTDTTRDAFNADYMIFCEPVGDLKYGDTNSMFQAPENYDLRSWFGHEPNHFARIAADEIFRREIMRNITTHKVNPVNDRITITAIEHPNGEPVTYKLGVPHGPDYVLNFQLGPIDKVGVNGITNEALLAVVLDRLNFFQKGDFKCRENALAITKLEECLLWLFSRTLDRMRRGVEGTHNV